MSRRSKPTPPTPDLAGPYRPAAVPASTAGRMALRIDELAASLGVSRRSIERERSAGRFPRPDIKIGKCPLWRPETIRRWIESGGGGEV